MSTGPAPIQFDNAEFGQGPSAPGGVTCAACKRPIVDQYFEAVSQVFCGTCATVLKAGPQGGSRILRTIQALMGGLIGGILGAIPYFLILKFTGYELGLIAIVVGVFVGLGVRRGGRGRGGWFYQLMAMGITYVAIATTHVPQIIEWWNENAIKEHQEAIANAKSTSKFTLHTDGTARLDDRELTVDDIPNELTRVKNQGITLLVYREDRAEAHEPSEKATALHEHLEELRIPMAYFQDASFQSPLYDDFNEIARTPARKAIALGVAFVFALVVPFLSLPQGIMGLVIIGIALWEAWKINKKPVLAITGPFMLSPSGPMGQGSIVHTPPPVMPPNPPPAFEDPPQGIPPS